MVAPTADFPMSLKSTYKDMSSHWAEKTVYRLAGMDVLDGYTDKTFKPDLALTRAELAVMLVKAIGINPGQSASLTFEDNHAIPVWARSSVAALYDHKIITGVAHKDGINNTFDADRPITRAEFATIINRAIEFKTGLNAEIKDVHFVDSSKFPLWAQESIDTVASLSIIDGYPGQVFGAQNRATRAEAAAMISRMLDLL
jgi:hypothetical protein